MQDNQQSQQPVLSALEKLAQGVLPVADNSSDSPVIINGNKIKNSKLVSLVELLKRQSVSGDNILNMLMGLDKLVEENKLTDDQLKNITNNSES